MKNKTMRVATLVVPAVACMTISDCQAGELLRSIQNEQK